MATAVFSFGRLNPPTTGHLMLSKKVAANAKKFSGKAFIFTGQSSDPKRNPLDYNKKTKYMKKAFKGVEVVNNNKIRTIFDALKYLDEQGYDDIKLVVGSDRVAGFKRLIPKYMKDYNFKTFDAISAGERDPDAEGVKGMSASKMRAAVKRNDYDTFRLGCPATLSDKDCLGMFNDVKKGMGIRENEEVNEELWFNYEEFEMFCERVVSLQTRKKMARTARRTAKKRARSRKRKEKFRKSDDKLKTLANKKAKMVLRGKLIGDKDWSSMSIAARERIDAQLQKKSKNVEKIAKKLYPAVKKQERERLQKLRGSGLEEATSEMNEYRRKDVFVIVNKKGKVVVANLTKQNAHKEISRHRDGTIVLDPDAKVGDILKTFAKEGVQVLREPEILDRLIQQLKDKGMDNDKANAVARSQLQKNGVLKKGSDELTDKGEKRNSMTPAERAKDRAAKKDGKTPKEYKYNKKTNIATQKEETMNEQSDEKPLLKWMEVFRKNLKKHGSSYRKVDPVDALKYYYKGIDGAKAAKALAAGKKLKEAKLDESQRFGGKVNIPASKETTKYIENAKGSQILINVQSALHPSARFLVIKNPNASAKQDKVLMAITSDPKRRPMKMFSFFGTHVSHQKAMDFAKHHKLVAMKDAKGNPLYAKESVELEEKATRTAVDKEFNKVTRSGKMDTLRAIRHVEKKFKIKDVKVQKDKNGKSHVISFDESAVAQRSKTIRRTFKFPSDEQAKQFEYDISNSGVAIGNRVGNKVTVKTGLDRKTAQAVAKYMKKSKGKMIKESIEEGSLGYKKALRSKNRNKKGVRSGNEREKAMDYRRWSAEKLRNKNIHSDHQLYPDPQDPKDVKKKLVNPLAGKGYPYNESIDEASEKQMIDMLRKEYGKLSKVDPSQPTYKKLTALLDKIAKVNPGLLKKLAKAKIKFVSTLAQNRLNEELNEAGDPRIAKMSDKGRKLLASLANVMDTTGGPYLDDKNVKFLTKQGVNATIKAADKAKLGGPGQRYLALIKKELGESIEEDTFKKKAVRDVKAKYDPKIDALKKRIADLKTKMDLKKSVKTSSSTLDALKKQHAAARKKREDAEAKVKASQERLAALRAKLNNSFDPMEDRDYKKEYANFHGKPEQRAKRSKRVLARREMIKSGKAKKGDGKDVDHKDGNANNNSPSNLRMMSVAKNRSRNNNKQHEEHGAGDEGTNKLIKKYKKDTPGA